MQKAFKEVEVQAERELIELLPDDLKEDFGDDKANYFRNNIERYINTGLVKQNNGIYNLTGKGMFVSDEIMANLMFI